MNNNTCLHGREPAGTNFVPSSRVVALPVVSPDWLKAKHMQTYLNTVGT